MRTCWEGPISGSRWRGRKAARCWEEARSGVECAVDRAEPLHSLHDRGRRQNSAGAEDTSTGAQGRARVLRFSQACSSRTPRRTAGSLAGSVGRGGLGNLDRRPRMAAWPGLCGARVGAGSRLAAASHIEQAQPSATARLSLIRARCPTPPRLRLRYPRRRISSPTIFALARRSSPGRYTFARLSVSWLQPR
jgi:hypothetical protein